MSRPKRWTVAPTRGGQHVLLGMAAVALVAMMAMASGRVAVGETIPTSQAKQTAVTCQINPNTATVGQLICLPSIGPTRARAIVAGRSRGPYRTAHDLDRVYGIGPATVRTIAPYLDVPPAR